MFEQITAYATSIIASSGLSAVFILSFLESFIFPIPTAVIILTATSLGLNPLNVTIFATVGSVIGAVVGHNLGLRGGRKILKRYVEPEKIKKIDSMFEKYGVYAVGIAGFTPIPFKLFTITAGVSNMRLAPFIGISIISRFAQFILFAYFGSFIAIYLPFWLGI